MEMVGVRQAAAVSVKTNPGTLNFKDQKWMIQDVFNVFFCYCRFNHFLFSLLVNILTIPEQWTMNFHLRSPLQENGGTALHIARGSRMLNSQDAVSQGRLVWLSSIHVIVHRNKTTISREAAIATAATVSWRITTVDSLSQDDLQSSLPINTRFYTHVHTYTLIKFHLDFHR